MRKMIAFQKLLFSMCFSSSFNRTEKRTSKEFILLSIYYLIIFWSLLRVSIGACMFCMASSYLLFLYSTLVGNPFIFRLPLKRRFALNGLFLFNGLWVIASFIFFFGIIYFFIGVSLFLSFIFSHTQFDSIISAVVAQELLIVICFSVVLLNSITPFLLIRKKSLRIAGVTAVTAVYCGCIYLSFPYTGGYFLVTNSLHNYLQSVSNGWQIAGLSVLLTVVFSLGCGLFAEGIDQYSRKHPRLEKITTAQ